MAQRRKFKGFLNPHENWSKLPHQLIDSMPLIKTVSELKVILYILRHTWGFHDSEKRITLDEFAHGRKRKGKKRRMDGGTGLSIPAIRAGIADAVTHGFITVVTDDHDKARVKKFYSLTEKHLQSEYNNVSSRLKNSFNRTKKETFERNTYRKNGTDPLLRKKKPSITGALADRVLAERRMSEN